MINRRDFLVGAAASAGLATAGRLTGAVKPDRIRSVLVHMGVNMWADASLEKWGRWSMSKDPAVIETHSPSDRIRFDESLWRELSARMVEKGMNQVVLDLGEAVRYDSHPELGASGAWSPDRLRKECARLRGMGLEVIPKLNFSTAHDTWLKEYGRQVSTPAYYRVCRDLIQEVCDIFDKPRFFHLGFDEETAEHQSQYEYVVVRQGDLWWHDFLLLVKAVEDRGVRPWIWSDFHWNYPEEFVRRMPRSVLQSNWHYGGDFTSEKAKASAAIKTFVDLDKAGFDQVPCGSNYRSEENIANMVKFCDANIRREHLLGYMIAPWERTYRNGREGQLFRAVDLLSAAVRGES